jgi:Cd2+/Zn2+-exporting ATPase
MDTPDENKDCSCSECGCVHDHEDGVPWPILVKTIGAGILVIITVIAETGFIYPPGIGIISAVGALILTAYPILKEAVSGLMGGERNVCELAGIAIVAAVLIREYTAAAEVALILTIGELAEAYTYTRSKRDIRAIVSKNPRYGYVIRNEDIILVPVREIRIGDRVMIRPGDMVPVDGKVCEGGSWLDESCLTGESIPVRKEKGEMVFSGTINADVTLIVQATSLSDDSAYSRIVALIKEAGRRRPPTHPFIDRFARVYSPVMIVLALLVGVCTGSVIRAITVLIVACPCALLLATPSAMLASLGSAAKKGILIKSGEFLEICKRITVVVMDKTGTITTGKMHVTDIVPLGDSTPEEILARAAMAECSSSHPVGKAILQEATGRGIIVSCGGKTRQYSGLGVEDQQDGRQVLVGTLRFMSEQGVTVPDHLRGKDTVKEGKVDLFVAIDRVLTGIIRVSDSIRPESQEVIRKIRNLGITRIEILTGDNGQVASEIAKACDIPQKAVHAGIYPRDKEQFIANLQKQGEVVCFVGDGTNDGPALARSELGVSIGSREDTIALETSGVILMRKGLSMLPEFLSLGKRSGRIISINIILALGLNAILVIGASAGWLSPALGAVGHQAATLVVLLNSTRLAYTWGSDVMAVSHSGCTTDMPCSCAHT